MEEEEKGIDGLTEEERAYLSQTDSSYDSEGLNYLKNLTEPPGNLPRKGYERLFGLFNNHVAVGNYDKKEVSILQDHADIILEKIVWYMPPPYITSSLDMELDNYRMMFREEVSRGENAMERKMQRTIYNINELRRPDQQEKQSSGFGWFGLKRQK